MVNKKSRGISEESALNRESAALHIYGQVNAAVGMAKIEVSIDGVTRISPFL